MKTPEEMAELYISEEYQEQLLKEIGPTDSLVKKVFLDGVKFGYKAAQEHIADASKVMDDHDTSYQQGYLDGVADTQAKAVKEDK